MSLLIGRWRRELLSAVTRSLGPGFHRRQMPKVDKFCTFRMIDVSSFKELLRRIDPMGFRPPRKRSDHTALTDAKGSLDELRFYVENYIRTDSDSS